MGHAAGLPGDRRAPARATTDRSRDDEAESTTSTSSSSRRSTPTAPRYSMYDSNAQRRTWSTTARRTRRATTTRSRATAGASTSTATSRVGSFFDGYQGASARLHQRHLRRPVRALRARDPQRARRSQTTFPNIKFAMNMHSYGGYFMWPPGAYKPARVTAAVPALRHAELLRPDRRDGPGSDQQLPQHGDPAAADRPGRSTCSTRPPATRPTRRTTTTASSATTSRSAPRKVLDRTARTRHRLPAVLRRGQHRRSAPAPATPTSSTRATTRAWSSPTATTRCSRPRWSYAQDTTAPVVGDRRAPRRRQGADLHVKFIEQRGVVDLLHDRRLDADHGVDRVEAATGRASCRTRSTSPPARTLKWIARRLQGQLVRGQARSCLGQTDTPGTVGGTVPATLALTLGAPATFGAFTPGVDARPTRPPPRPT